MAIKNFNIQHGLSLGDTPITIVDDNANVYASTLTVTLNSNLGNLATANFFSGKFDSLSSNQSNITRVGTLQSVNVSGDANIQGNLTVGGMLTYIDSTKISLVDPILELGGGNDGAALSTNDSLDRGTLLHYYTSKSVDAFMGWKNNDGQFVFGSNVTEVSGTVTVNQYANVKASNYLGNLIGDYANLSNLYITSAILRDGKNVPTFITSATLPTNPLLGDEWYDQANDRIYQYIFDGSNYNWVDISAAYISANVQTQAGTLAVRDTNGNIYANTLSANTVSAHNLSITGTTSFSSMVSAKEGIPVSKTLDTLIDTFPKTLYRSAKYIVSARNDDGFEVAEILMIHDNTVSFIQTYGDVSTGIVQDIATFSSNIVSGNVCLYATGSNSNTFVNLVSTYVTD